MKLKATHTPKFPWYFSSQWQSVVVCGTSRPLVFKAVFCILWYLRCYMQLILDCWKETQFRLQDLLWCNIVQCRLVRHYNFLLLSNTQCTTDLYHTVQDAVNQCSTEMFTTQCSPHNVHHTMFTTQCEPQRDVQCTTQLLHKPTIFHNSSLLSVLHWTFSIWKSKVSKVKWKDL